MIKFLFVGFVVIMIYKFWNTSNPPLEKRDRELVEQEPDDFAEYEELD